MNTELKTQLRSKRVEDRLRAVSILANRADDADAQELLLAALLDKSPYVALRAAKALVEGAVWGSAPILLDRFHGFMEAGTKRDPGSEVRAHLALALARLGYRPAIEPLRAGLRTREPLGPHDGAAPLRSACARALSQLRPPTALLDLALLLFEKGGPLESPEPQKAAAEALGRLGDPAAIVPLALKLAHPEGENPEVLGACMESVLMLEDDRALELFLPYLYIKDEPLVAQAALMIARTGEPSAPALLQEVADGLSGELLHAVILAIASIRSDASLRALHELARHHREAVRLSAVQSLVGLPDPDTETLLASLATTDPSARVRAAAKEH